MQVIAGGVGEILLDAEVAFGGLDRGVVERELDLVELGAALVGEFRKGAPEVVGRDRLTVSIHGAQNPFGAEPLAR